MTESERKLNDQHYVIMTFEWLTSCIHILEAYCSIMMYGSTTQNMPTFQDHKGNSAVSIINYYPAVFLTKLYSCYSILINLNGGRGGGVTVVLDCGSRNANKPPPQLKKKLL